MLSFRFTFTLLAALVSVPILSAGRVVADEARGVITSVDLNKNELRLNGRGAARGETLTFALDAKTLVLFGQEKATTADLCPGKRVRVEYENQDGRLVARLLRVSGRPNTPQPSTPVAAGDAITGVLQRVARTDRELVVVGPGANGADTETTVAVSKNAKIVKDGKPAALEALKEGDAVAVHVEHRDGKLSALEVQAGQRASLPAAPATARERIIPRLRQALHLADELLRRLDPNDNPSPCNPAKP